MHRRISVLLLALLLSGAGAARAQTSAGTSSITIGTVLYIAITNSSVSFPTVTQAHYDAMHVVGSATSLVTTKGNVTHSVSVRADAATMTASGSAARSGKPASDLQVRVRPNGGAWGAVTPLSTSETTVVSGRAAGDHSATPPEVEYRIMLDWTADTPGTYTLGFTYTVIPG